MDRSTIDRVGDDDLELVDPASLEPHPDNPREHADAAIRRSIDDHGVIDVCVVQRSRRRILGGHGRWENAVAAGATRIPVVWVDCDDDEAQEILLVLNRTADKATYRNEALASLLSRIVDSGRQPERAGWGADDLRRFVARVDAERRAENLPPEPPVPDVPADVVTRPGDMWALGMHRLVCGDCRDPAVADRLMAGVTVNVAVTSPPYADRRKYDESSGFEPIPPDEYVRWFEPVAANVAAHLAGDGSWFVNIKPGAEGLDTEPYVLDLVLAHVREWGWHFATEFCWERNGVPKSVTQRFKNQFEPVYQFTRGRWKMRPDQVRHTTESAITPFGEGAGQTSWVASQGSNWRPGEFIGPGVAYPGNRLPTFAGTHEALGHTAAFPVGLPAWFVRAYTDPGDSVLDPFAGSGSTIIAAEHEHRIGYGIELSPAYCDVIVHRWERLTGQTAVRT